MTPEQVRQTQEGKFIQNLGDKSNRIMVDESLTPAQLDAKYHEMLDGTFDIDAINEFVISRTWQQAAPEKKQEYLKLFKEQVIKTYGDHLRFHKNEVFQVNDDVRDVRLFLNGRIAQHI